MASIDASIQAFAEASAKVKNRGAYFQVNRRSQICLVFNQTFFEYHFQTFALLCKG
jgi:hypothetical protein